MFSSKLFLTLAAVASAASTAVLSGEVVSNPTITSPQAGDSWAVGSVQTVTWDVSTLTPDEQQQTGLILLGFIEYGSSDEHLDIKNPLASGFPINTGAINVRTATTTSLSVRFQIPLLIHESHSLIDGVRYMFTVFGDSGNTSPLFTIHN